MCNVYHTLLFSIFGIVHPRTFHLGASFDHSQLDILIKKSMIPFAGE